MSLRTRLLVSLLTVMSLVSVSTIILSYQDASHEIQELFDAELAQSARVTLAVVLPKLDSIDITSIQERLDNLPQHQIDHESNANEISQFGHEYETKIAFQIVNRMGDMLLRSPSAPQTPLAADALHPTKRGFSDTVIDGNGWRVFSLWDTDNHYLIQVGERHDVREELVTEISYQLITPAIVALPILGLLMWIAINQGLSPIQQLSQQVTQRDPRNLASLNDEHSPRELRPLIHVLNELFSRLTAAFVTERQFTDDAAHELRTPLAALKVQAQVAQRSQCEKEQQEALSQVIKGVDRNTHLLEQLLTLARLDNVDQDNNSNVDIISLIKLNINELQQHADNKMVSINFQSSIETEITMFANPYSLSCLFRNLLENAINYSPNNGHVDITIAQHMDTATLRISDTGRGIEQDILPRIFDRFYRAPGNSVPGCGLGLSIVKRIAELYGIEAELKNREDRSGSVAHLTLPLVASVVTH